MQHSQGLVVEVDERSCCVASDIDLEGLCPDPVVLRGILVGIYYKVIAFSSMEDDVVQIGERLDEVSIGCYEC